jgi:probable F420-dependent oxidoreductase
MHTIRGQSTGHGCTNTPGPPGHDPYPLRLGHHSGRYATNRLIVYLFRVVTQLRVDGSGVLAPAVLASAQCDMRGDELDIDNQLAECQDWRRHGAATHSSIRAHESTELILIRIDITAERALDPDVIVAAEQDGYDAVWFGETAHDPMTSIALAAKATSRIQLGTGVAIALARSPMTLAVTANDLQLATEGRLLLGLGSQVKAHVTRRFSMPWGQPVAQMREFVLAMRAIWRSWHEGEKLAFEGEYYSHTLMTPFFNPGPNPHGPPPVLLAGVGARMSALAGEVADGFMCHGFLTERYLREVILPSLRHGREASGQDMSGFEISGLPFVVTGTTEEEIATAAAAVRDQIAFYAATPAYRAVLDLHGWGDLQGELNVMTKNGQWKEMGGLIDDDMLGTFAVVAEPDKVAAEVLQRYGNVFTRMHLYLKSAVDRELLSSMREQLQAAG